MRYIYNLLIIFIIIPNALIGQTYKDHIAPNSCNYDFSGVIDNDMKNYPVRINGWSYANFGQEDGNAKIPRNIDLYYAILLINQDYNGDSVIDISDLPDKIKEVGDINNDKLMNIYDIIYPKKINYLTSLYDKKKMDITIKDGEIATITGDFIFNTSKIGSMFLKLHHTVTITVEEDGNGDGLVEMQTTKLEAGDVIHITNQSNLIMHEDKTVVLKGYFGHGTTYSYPYYFLFFTQEVLGVKK